MQDDRPDHRSFDKMPWRLVTGGCVIGLFMGLLAYFAAHSYLQLAADEITFRRLWSFESERYPYSRITALQENGKPGDRGASFSIHFGDTPAWSTRQEIVFPGPAEKQHLAARTGLRIERTP